MFFKDVRWHPFLAHSANHISPSSRLQTVQTERVSRPQVLAWGSQDILAVKFALVQTSGRVMQIKKDHASSHFANILFWRPRDWKHNASSDSPCWSYHSVQVGKFYRKGKMHWNKWFDFKIKSKMRNQKLECIPDIPGRSEKKTSYDLINLSGLENLWYDEKLWRINSSRK